MAQVKVTAELLRGFAQTLQTEKERFEAIKSQMDEQLFGFLWEDAVSVKFKADYDERLQSLKTKLLPAMEKYRLHLDGEAAVIDSYTENGSPSLSAFKAAAISAGVVGAGAAAAAGTTVGQGITGDKLFKTVKAEELVSSGNNNNTVLKKDSFNKDAAISKLQAQAKPQGVKRGQCAAYVKQALQEGGIEISDTEKGHAYVYKDLLPKKGFEEQDITFTYENGTYVPSKEILKGDIVVFDRIPKIKGKEFGHIAMYDGQQWISDFKQNYFKVWSNPAFEEQKYTIFRFKK